MFFSVANRIFRSLGYQLHPILHKGRPVQADRARLAPIRLDMTASLAHLRALGFMPSLIVDVGAAHGTAPLLKTWPKSRSLWVEPLKEFEPRLKSLAERHPGRYLIAAADAKRGSLEINVHADLFGSSLLRERDGQVADGTPRKVPVVRLDDEVDFTALGNDVLLKVDVQGAELNVLEGATRLLQHCAVVILEVNFFEMQEGSPQLLDVLNYMHDKGFVAYDIFDGHNRPLDDALAQRDILFVEEHGRFRSTHKWSTPVQRKRLLGKLEHSGA